MTDRPVVHQVWTGWPAARRLLHGSFRRLLIGQCLGQAGDGLAQIAFAQFVVFEANKSTSPSRIAVLLAITLLPFSLVGPFAGVVIDRHRRQRVLIVTSLVRAAIALVAIDVVIHRSQAGALVGVLLLLSMSRFVLAAKGAALPRTVEPDDLLVANALSGLAGMAATFLGAVGGSAFVGRSVASGFVSAAVLYSVAAFAFAKVPGLGGKPAVKHAVHQPTAVLRSGLRDFREGLRAILGTRDLLGPLVAVTAHRMLLGAGFVLLVLITNSQFHLRIAGYGLALAVTGVASLGGTLAAPALARLRPPRLWLPLTFLPPAVGCLIAAISPGLTLLIASLAVTAFSFQVLKVLVDALVGRASPDEVRGRVFSVYDVVYNVAFVAAGLLMIPLWHPGRARHLLWLLAAGFLLASAAMTRRKTRRNARAQRPPTSGSC